MLGSSTGAEMVGSSTPFDPSGTTEGVLQRIASTTRNGQVSVAGSGAGPVDGTKAIDISVEHMQPNVAAKRGFSAPLLIAGVTSCAGAAAALAVAAQAVRDGMAGSIVGLLVISSFTCMAAVTWLAASVGRSGSEALRVPLAGRRYERAALESELQRSRRYERPLAVVRMAPAPTGRRDARWRDGLPMSAGYGDRIGYLLRETDRWWQEGHSLYFVLPEADRAHADCLVQRLARELPGLPSQVWIAAFPEDGVTTAALWAALERAQHTSAVSA